MKLEKKQQQRPGELGGRENGTWRRRHQGEEWGWQERKCCGLEEENEGHQQGDQELKEHGLERNGGWRGRWGRAEGGWIRIF